MIWIFIVLAGLLAGSFGLGALTIWASVLMLAVKASIVVIAALTVALLVSMLRRR